MINLNAYERIMLFLEKYGEKGLLVLKAAYDISQDPNVDHKLGDFSFKHLVLRLTSIGLNYNPINILRIMEKEYRIVEKSYSSSNQTWWRFVDVDAVRSILSDQYGAQLEDPVIKSILIKYRSIEPRSIVDTLKRLLVKEGFTNADKEIFKNIVFNVLDKVVWLINEMEKYEEVFNPEIRVLKEILNLADMVSNKLDKPRNKIYMSSDGALNANTRVDLIENTDSIKRYHST
ncbi:MAG: hypothetical protein QXE81_06345 [Desulfurococcaceae archaeon]